MWIKEISNEIGRPWEAQGQTDGILSERGLGTGGTFPWLIYTLCRGKGLFYQDIFLTFSFSF